MDLSQSIIPKSDQINAEDLLTGPRTFTIDKVVPGSAEQPVNIHLTELPGRPYRPSKSMLRVLVSAWGTEAATYAGRRLTLFRNPSIKWGGAAVGGIEISHMSDLPKRLTVSLMVTKGQRKPFSVDPLADLPPARDFVHEAALAGTDLSLLRALYTAAQKAGESSEVLDQIRYMASVASEATPDETPAS